MRSAVCDVVCGGDLDPELARSHFLVPLLAPGSEEPFCEHAEDEVVGVVLPTFLWLFVVECDGSIGITALAAFALLLTFGTSHLLVVALPDCADDEHGDLVLTAV